MSWRTGGIRPWIVQRLSAVLMVVVMVLFAFVFMSDGVSNFHEWQAWMSGPFWNTVIIMFWIGLIAHAWIGMRDILMDYIYADTLRLIVLTSFALYLGAMLIWALRIMLLAGA